MSEWLTYEVGKGGSLTTVEKKADARRGFGMRNPRPATEDEIAAVLAKRDEHARYTTRMEVWKKTIAYQCAEIIRSKLELMTLDDNPLDRLTPEEWHTLMVRLTENNGGAE